MKATKQYYHIQILRALAVLMVIFFHLDSKLLPNGYLGVDIFFVISGFVITNSIINSYNKDNFTFLSFYTNRVKRLFPALFFVIITTCIFAFCIFTFNEYYSLKETRFWYTPLQISNFGFAFYRKSYWEAGDASIYLHTWSLGVEEQIYLVFPLILLGIYLVYKKEPKPIQFLFCILSLVSIYFFITINEQLSFYMPYTRAWEFLAGTIVFFIFNTKKVLQFKTKYLFLIFTILLVLLSYYGFTANKHHLPKSLEQLLLPIFNKHGIDFIYNKFLLIFLTICLSGLTILFGLTKQIKLNFFTKFFIHLGNLSYSLYLWHFPIIVFYKKLHITFTGIPANKVDYLIIFIIIYILSYFSYYFIENPLRKIKTNSRNKQILVLVTSITVMFLTSYFMYISTKYMLPYYKHTEDETFTAGLLSINHDKLSLKKYDFGFKNSALYVGDSHGSEKNIAMIDWAKRNHFNIYIGTQPGCFTINYSNKKIESKCFKTENFINKTLLTDTSINTIILLYNKTKTTYTKINLTYLLSIKPNARYILLGDQPDLTVPIYYCVRDFTLLKHSKYLQNIMKKHKCLTLNFKVANQENQRLSQLVKTYQQKGTNIQFISMSQYYTTPEYKGKFLFRDNHLTLEGINYISKHPKAFHFKIN